MKSQPGWHTITKHTLPNISRNKGNQTMKFGLINRVLPEYNISSKIIQEMRQGDSCKTL